MHRLNRTEYANAIRDLLDLEVNPAALLPVDGAEDGFNNIASALQVTPAYVDQYLSAARVVSDQAVGSPAARPSGSSYGFASGQNSHIDGLPLGTRGGGVIEHYFPSDGTYHLNIGNMASGLAFTNLEHLNTLIATVDGEKIFEMDFGGLDQTEQLDKLRAPALEAINARMQNISFTTTAGPHKVAVFFLHRSFAESDSPLQQVSPRTGQSAVASLSQIEIFGPLESTGLSTTPSRAKIFSCYPDRDAEEAACSRQIITGIANRAFKGFLGDEDTDLLMGMYDTGYVSGGFEGGINFALSGILAHPKFLYRIELDPENLPANSSYPLNSMELASRISFFLWSSIPDDELLRVASQDGLNHPDILETQVRRMLADPRARNLASNFAYQWLGLGGLADVTPDRQLFNDVDINVRRDMTEEVLLFLASIFRDDHSVVDILTANHTYLNEPLALHYGINTVRGSRFRRVALDDERRWGILGKGAVLMVSSYPNRTSPVLRGTWLLENIMGTPPAAPPPDVEGFVEIEIGQEFSTVRERLESHRGNPSCNSCHGVIDPLGFALENFDATGRWRDRDRHAGTDIDASGVMADGTALSGPVALREAITARPEQFVQTFTEKLMTFGLGRKLEYTDMPAVREIVRESAVENYRFSSLVMNIINSDQFRYRSVSTVEE